MVNLSYTTMQRAADHKDNSSYNVRSMGGSSEIGRHTEFAAVERSNLKARDDFRDGGFFNEGYESVRPLQYAVGGSIGPARNHHRNKDQAHVHIWTPKLSE